jgi:hypothetical protein
MSKRGASAVFALLIAFYVPGCSRPQFPEWTGVPLGLLGNWERASSVVVADLRNVHYLGSPEITKPPWSKLPDRFTVYWCEADFVSHASVRGRLPRSGKKFLWGGARPGCEVNMPAREAPEGAGPRMRVWFVREDGEYIRPVVDGFGPYFVELRANWEVPRGADPQRVFAQLLLSPAAVDEDARHYGQHWDFDLAMTACHILGKPECIEQINRLASLGDPLLRRRACEFLTSQFRAGCGA